MNKHRKESLGKALRQLANWRLSWHVYVAGIAIGIFLGLSFWSIRHFGYVMSPGADQINHFSTLQTLRAKGITGLFSAGYPSLFHGGVLMLMTIFGASFQQVLLALWPLSIVGGALAVAALIRALTSNRIASLSIPFFLFALAQPVQTLEDGGFPSYLGVTVFIPLLLLGLHTAAQNNWQKKYLIKPAIGFLLLSIFHQITMLYVLAVFIVFTIGRYYRRPLLVVAGIAAVFLFYISPLGKVARDLFETVFNVSSTYPWLTPRIAQEANVLIPLKEYPVGIGYAPFWFGLMGVGAALYVLRRKSLSSGSALVLTLILILACLQLFASRMIFLGFPVRVMRDLAVPLFVLAAIAIQFLLNSQKNNRAKVLVVAVLLLTARAHVLDKYGRFITFNPAMQLSPAVGAVFSGIDLSKTAALNIPYADLYRVPNYNENAMPLDPSIRGPWIATLDSALAKKQYVVFQLRKSEPTWQPEVLRKLGFTEEKIFRDPVYDTYRYSR